MPSINTNVAAIKARSNLDKVQRDMDTLEYDNRSFPYSIEFHSAEQIKGWNLKKTDFKEAVKFINPWRIFSAIFRPFPGEAGGAIGIVVGLESMFLLIISIITLVKFFLKKVRMDMVSWILLSHILFWGILYGAILDFNWGYLFRQKVIVLPFVLSFIFIIHNKSSKMIN